MVVVITAIASLAGWSLKPNEPRVITRFSYDLPPSHVLRGPTRALIAVSPDGRRFVYNTVDGLYLRSMDALEARLLPGTEEPLESPVFSPDGQSLAYYTRADRQLKRLALSVQVWQRPVMAIAVALLLVAITGLAVWSLTRPAPPGLVGALSNPPGRRPNV